MKGFSEEWLRANRRGISDEDLERTIAGIEPVKRKPSHVPGRMNYTELRFSQFLDDGKWLVPICGWRYEPVTFPLSPDMVFTPDFEIVSKSEVGHTVEYVDVKGKHVWEDSIIKGKAAAVIFPQYRFYLAQLKGGFWHIRQVGVKPRKTYKVQV